MAKETLGRNITFPIYNENGTPFHNLVLEKAVVDSVVMSLGDKITGDVYYRDNTLDVTMREYIIYKKDPQNENEDAVKYVLVNPPTIVREGLVSDNSELKGMTKYSFVFYHPMYILNNIPFTDIAVSSDEERYKSQDRSFSWIGYLNDFVNKLNKNLEGTEWIVVSNATDANTVLSDVLTFDNSTIAEALKKAYDTWGTPFIIDKIDEGEAHYSEGKRFSVLIGTPSNTITRNGSEYVFRFGQGLGLKNNSATPRNNKIITRIAGYGSEDNIPYGYPQIVWTGDSTWEYTINNTSGMQSVVVNGVTVQAMSYPIYDGIVGGQNVKLIKHPFTRTHLMPSVYCETVDRKVNPLNSHYNPQTTIIDYYDALDNTYTDSQNEYISFPNNIDPQKPSYEIHQFDGIKPELGSAYLAADAIPVNADQSEASGWDDTMDGDGNYNQSYFKIILPPLGFDLYACAAITQEMKIAMRGGACIGCTFIVQVNWESYKANFYDSNGNFAPNGTQRNLEYFPDTTQNAVAIIVQKDLGTFGTIMPNVYQQPHAGDTFAFLGISLPLTYITNAQTRLDNEMVSYMRENNIYYFDYPLKFDEYFLAKNTDILLQIRNNSAIKFQFAETTNTLYVKQITIKYGNGTLPQYDITLTDKIEAEINKIGQMIDESVNRITTVQATFVDVPYTLTQSVRSKMSADWFQRLFVAYDANNNIVSPNDTQTEIARICALYDFYSVGGVSSLGFSSGGGGSASLKALLASLNDSTIGNTAPTISQNEKCPIWVQTTENNGHWEWGTTGGGGGTGTLPNDIAYWDDDDGTVIYVDENGNVVSLAEYAKKTWVQEQIAQIPSSSFNEAAMWTALGTNDSTKLIDDSHISATIKSGAAAGATAIQLSDLNTALGSYYTKNEANGLFVHLTGNVNETITGVKTFSDDIVATRIKIGNAYISYNSNGLCIDDGNGGSMNLYATGGVSSLGIGSSGSVGASSLAELSDVNISSPIDGQGLVYDSATQKWVNGTVGGGGGGGISLADVWTSLAANNTSNKIHFSHLPNTIHVVDALHIDEYGYIENSNNIRFDLPNKSSGSYTLATTADIQNIDLTGYATISWVEGENYLKSNQTITLSGDVSGSGTTSITTTIGTSKVKTAMIANNAVTNDKLQYSSITIGSTSVSLGSTLSAATLLDDLDDTFDGRYVTKTTTQIISGQKTFTASLLASNDIYLNKTTGSDLQQWVHFKNGLKNFSFGQEGSYGDCVLYSANSVNFYTNVNGNPYALYIQGSTGNVGIGKNNPTYKFDVSGNIHTDSAYYLDGRLFANNDTNNNTGLHIGYEYAVDDSENPSPLPTTLWGDGISFRSAGGTYGGCTKIDDTHGNITYGIMATDFIGVTNKFRFEYDSNNNTVWVLKANGTAVNFASLGGVTSLGVGASGTPNISSMNIATLTSTTVNATTLNNSVIKPIGGIGPTIEAPYIDGNDEEETYGVVFNYITRNSHYLTDFYNIGLLGKDADENETWSIEPNGSATFASENVGVLNVGSSLIVGSSGSSVSKILWGGTYLEVTIGTKIYKFIPDQTSNA